ncbi:response regulator [Roseiterribacter gracilis]|uniref:Response regulator n=1 Tax=Roseiterribacter gracilis TaxID=2812848 RepID=A0A8S8XEE2_9PROT|nr:response regulator [Rhodospirillales bacterium TMPK1]
MARILVVDDEQVVCDLVESILQSAGHVTRRALDGAHAVELIAQEKFDLILTDIFMPGEDGLGLLRHLRLLQPALPVLAFTGKSDATFDALEFAAKLGAAGVLRKPLERSTLLAAVHRIVPATT